MDTIEDHKKDPRGLVLRDLEELRRAFPARKYAPSDDIATVMYEEGKQRVLEFIETKMIAGHRLRL